MKTFRFLVCTLTLIFVMAGVVEAGDSYWEKQELPVIVNFEDPFFEEDETNLTTEDISYEEDNGIKDIDEYVHQILEEEKDNIYVYFLGVYGIDVSAKLEKLKDIYYFVQDDWAAIETVNGYVMTDDNKVHLNVDILKDEITLRNVIVHETLHYLGVKGAQDDLFFLMVEGFADALTNDILTLSDEEFVESAYENQRMLAEQLLIADDGFVEHFLADDDFNVGEYFNKKLSGIPQKTFRGRSTINNFADCLEKCIQSMYYSDIMSSSLMFYDFEDYETDESEYYDYIVQEQNEYFYYMLQAQYIVSAYCKECNPTYEQIEYIRYYQLFNWLEEMEFVE